MKYYMAPLEGITTCIFRNAYQKYFHPLDKYFTPFLVPHEKKGFSEKEKEELLPGNNQGYYLVPQILSNNAKDCLQTIDKLQVYGYREINLNMGCPSKCVASKGRGSGFLANTYRLDRFLHDIFEGIEGRDIRISIKTRVGRDDPEEFYEILDIYNQYPLEELIIHPRVQKDYYMNHPRMPFFDYGLQNSKHSVCYNGDVFTVEVERTICEEYPELDAVMLGRGLVRNPAIVEEILGIEDRKLEKIKAFHNELLEAYIENSTEEVYALHKMKEIWSYLGTMFPEKGEDLMKIRLTNCGDEYRTAVEAIFG